MPSEIVQQIMDERGVGRRRAYDIARQMSAEKQTAEAFPTSLKPVILEILYRDGAMDAKQLTRAAQTMGIRTTLAEVTSAVWAEQKQGLVQFRERHIGHGSELTNVKLSPAGRTKAVELRGTPKASSTRVNGPAITEKGFAQSPRGGAVHAAGIDPTDFRHHRKRTTGGDVERERHHPVKEGEYPYATICAWDKEAWPCIVASERGITAQAQPEVIPSPVISKIPGERPPFVAGALPAETLGDKPEWTVFTKTLPQHAVAAMAAADQEAAGIDPTDFRHHPFAPPPDIDLGRFPQIKDIADRSRKAAKYRAAAELLQDDDEDAALMLLEKVKFSDLEEEILGLLKGVGLI